MFRELRGEQLEVYLAPGGRGLRAGLGLTGPETFLEEVPIVGWASFPAAQRRNIPAHSHEGYEIIYLTRGSADWWVGDSVYELTPGDIYLTRPGEQHGLVNAILSPSEHYWIQVQFGEDRSLPGMSTQDAQALSRDLDTIQYRCFAASRESSITACFRHILEEHRSPGQYSTALARTALHALLICVIRDHAAHARRLELRQTALSTIMRDAMELIDKRFDEPLSALKIPARSGMGSGQFHSRFLTEVGWTPVEYRTRCRIQRAKVMLRDDRLTITEIAFGLGFRTSQYFATAFKRVTGVTPGEYREQVRRS